MYGINRAIASCAFLVHVIYEYIAYMYCEVVATQFTYFVLMF